MARNRRTRIERGIYEERRPSGKRLIVRIQVEGRDRSRTLPNAATIEDARRLRRELEAVERPTPVQVTTVRAYAQRWIRGKAATVRTSTLDHYIEVIGRRLLPAVVDTGAAAVVFGDLPAAEVRRGHTIAWVEWATRQHSRAGRPYSTSTLGSWWRAVKTLLRDLAADFEIRDPVDRVAAPKSPIRNVRQGETLTGEQLARLLATIDRSWPSWSAEVRMMALTGMRPGELYALRWMDIDDTRGLIAIRRSVRRGVVDLPKNGRHRAAALSTGLRTVLARHRLSAILTDGDALVFPAAGGGFRGAEALAKVLRLASLEAKLSIRVGPLVLRRTFNTLAAEGGAPPVVLRSQMGHTTAAMTQRYAGVHDEAKRRMVAKLEGEIVGSESG